LNADANMDAIGQAAKQKEVVDAKSNKPKPKEVAVAKAPNIKRGSCSYCAGWLKRQWGEFNNPTAKSGDLGVAPVALAPGVAWAWAWVPAACDGGFGFQLGFGIDQSASVEVELIHSESLGCTASRRPTRYGNCGSVLSGVHSRASRWGPLQLLSSPLRF
jgi:hypothetical protein